MSAAAPASGHDDDEDGAAAVSEQRLDKWLWFARVVKSRTLAAGLVSGGKVRVNRQRVDKPSHWLKPGDVVTVSVGRKVRVLKVRAPGVRRGPAVEAGELFEELTPVGAPSMRHAAPSGVAPAVGVREPGEREQGAGRPTKRERRDIDKLRGRR